MRTGIVKCETPGCLAPSATPEPRSGRPLHLAPRVTSQVLIGQRDGRMWVFQAQVPPLSTPCRSRPTSPSTWHPKSAQAKGNQQQDWLVALPRSCSSTAQVSQPRKFILVLRCNTLSQLNTTLSSVSPCLFSKTSGVCFCLFGSFSSSASIFCGN